ncbi:MAG TPA: penicillin acylase family protein, partial [Edaphobacter sp.]
RDAHGVPHIHANSLDDLIFAQGFVTAGDRLFQMDILRRHAAGELAEVLGTSLLPHDRTQRILQIRAAADRAVAALPSSELHYLEVYARGVNASIDLQRSHLPLEFRVLRYEPKLWVARDSILVGLAMFEDLTNAFPVKLSREAIAAHLSPELVADLYPVGSWRDHPPAQPLVDLTQPQPNIPNVPLDESQTKLKIPDTKLGAPSRRASSSWMGSQDVKVPSASSNDLLALQKSLRDPLCDSCFSGSNNWVVSGTRTASGKPLLSNDMHLSHNIPGVWYQADLDAPSESGEFRVAGVSLPGLPFIVVGHNAHVAWGFTNLGADVQDVYIEQLRGSGQSAQFLASDGSWQPVYHQTEVIHIRGSHDVALDVTGTRHGSAVTPIISPLLPSEKRALSLRWTVYDPDTLNAPMLAINSANDWASFTAAFSTFGGPGQNVVYADDQGHIGYHAVGYIPVRGNPAQPSPLSPVPVAASDTSHEWAGNIPFDQLPQAFDPPSGVLATANARVTPDNYPFPITLDWAAPYRNERIWKVLLSRDHLAPADMLKLETDTYSDLDRELAERLAYAIDHSGTKDRRLRQAADLLRKFDGNVTADTPAVPIVIAARNALWSLILAPKLGPATASSPMRGGAEPLWQLYSWGEKVYAGEQIIMHTPNRWLPPNYSNWDALLTAAVERGLAADAPADLTHWSQGKAHPVDIEHPIFSRSPLLHAIIGMHTGTGVQPQSGDTSTVKQVDRTFGPSERFTADFSDFDQSTLNLVLGESGNPASPWFMDQWSAWYNGTTFPMPFSPEAVHLAATHTLTLTPN